MLCLSLIVTNRLMQLMKFHALWFPLVLLLGCASPTQKPAQQLPPVNIATHSDNRIALKATSSAPRKRAEIHWAWMGKSTDVLGLEVDGAIYNARDIAQIRSKPNQSGSHELTIVFRDGRKIVSSAGYLYSGGEAKVFGPAWRACKSNGTCKERYPLASTNTYNNLGGLLSGLSERDLASPQVYGGASDNKLQNSLAGMLVKDPELNIVSDPSSVLAVSGALELIILIDDEYLALEKRITALRTRWAAEIPKRSKILADLEQERIDADNNAQQAAIKAGHVNCVSTSYTCGGTYSDVTSLNCHTFNSAVWKMAKAGWRIESVTPQLAKGSLGEACDHYIYHFSFSR